MKGRYIVGIILSLMLTACGPDFSASDLDNDTDDPGSPAEVLPAQYADEDEQPPDYPDPYIPERTDFPMNPREPGNPQPVSCQGHAVDVLLFSPGLGAGFGGSDFPDIVLGPPEGNGSGSGGFDVLSLGRLGEIVLDLGTCNLVDGPGVDLIVFENPFFISGDPNTPFSELGVVGVSDDGVNFVEFSCDDSGYPYTGCAGWNPVYSASSNNISPFDVANAGGDQFDLDEIAMESARYVRIRDVSDFGGGGTAGFDLDAISVINGEEIP